MDRDDITARFVARQVDEETGHLLMEVREAVEAAALRVNELAPDGSEKWLALTKLEEAVFWANAAIARRAG